MNIIERGQDFVQKLRDLAQRTVWDWRRCPRCGGTQTARNGGRWVRPVFLDGQKTVRIQRHVCHGCGKFYDEEHAFLVRGSWYAREVHRYAVDEWMHQRGSLRRGAEFVRSWAGRQERWRIWHVWEQQPEGEGSCRFHHSTLHRWLDRAGREAEKGIEGQLKGLHCSGQMGADGLWARQRGGGKSVLLGLVDSVTGVIWATRVVAGEELAANWQKLLDRGQQMGLALEALSGLTSDGAQGLLSYLRESLGWVHHQRCVWHVWRNLAGDLAKAVTKATQDLAEDAAKAMEKTVRQELTALLHKVIDASGYEQAEQALAQLKAHPFGGPLAKKLNEQFDHLLYPLLPCHQGLVRISPEWLWRDFRLRLSHGRNHGTDERLDRAGLLWAIYHNFTPAQRRKERKRHYKHPGQSPLEVAGGAPGEISYLDALGV